MRMQHPVHPLEPARSGRLPLRAALVVVAALGGLLAAGPAQGQERRVEAPDLPRHVAEAVIEYFNDPTTIRLQGDASIPPGRVVVGNVAHASGVLRLAGEVDGSLVVANGRLELAPGARVTGDVTVVGGRVEGAEGARIAGTLTLYGERLLYEQRAGRLVYTGPRQPLGVGRDGGPGRSRLILRSGTSYSRVEGLPVMFGPVVETEGLNPLRVEAFGIWRSTSGLRLVGEELGYSLLVEQRLFARRDAGVGVTLQSQVLPVEAWGLTDLESSLATFLLRRDYRDYYDARGWSGFVRSGVPGTPLVLQFDYREERHRFAPVESPWSLRGGDDPWRAQPLVGEGRTSSLGAELSLDTRNETHHPSAGWLIRAGMRAGVGGDLTLPAYTGFNDLGLPVELPERRLDGRYERGFLDLRRYNRVSPTSRLSLRVLAGGSLSGHALPPQFQLALGGEGSLPGHPRFTGDCGARSREGRFTTTVRRGDDRGSEVLVPAWGAYGCDRIALFQVEYQGDFQWDPIRGTAEGEGTRAGRDEWEWRSLAQLTPGWSVFFNTGRGWALPARHSPDPVLDRGDSETLMDLGAGVVFGGLGLYWAVPLDSRDSGVNFFIRLSQRF